VRGIYPSRRVKSGPKPPGRLGTQEKLDHCPSFKVGVRRGGWQLNRKSNGMGGFLLWGFCEVMQGNDLAWSVSGRLSCQHTSKPGVGQEKGKNREKDVDAGP